MAYDHPRLVESGIESPQSGYELSTEQYHDIGQCARMVGGKVFYYARYSAAATTAAGLVFSAATPDASGAFENTTAVGTIAQGERLITGITAANTLSTAITERAY